MARERLLDARKAVLKGISPALEKQREKRRVVAIKTFGTAMDTWLANARLAMPTWQRRWTRLAHAPGDSKLRWKAERFMRKC